MFTIRINGFWAVNVIFTTKPRNPPLRKPRTLAWIIETKATPPYNKAVLLASNEKPLTSEMGKTTQASSP